MKIREISPFLPQPDTKKVQLFRTALSGALARMRNTLKSGGRVNLAPLVHIDRLVACGPDRAGLNLLFCAAKRLTESESNDARPG